MKRVTVNLNEAQIEKLRVVMNLTGLRRPGKTLEALLEEGLDGLIKEAMYARAHKAEKRVERLNLIYQETAKVPEEVLDEARSMIANQAARLYTIKVVKEKAKVSMSEALAIVKKLEAEFHGE